MDSNEPQPFGCMLPSPVRWTRVTDIPNLVDHFVEPPNNEGFAGSPSVPNRQELLTDSESALLTNFFSSEPFQANPPTFDFSGDAKTATDNFNWPFIAPANVHQVSTSIPDHAQFYRTGHTEHFLGPDAFGGHQYPATQQDDPQVIQAASALWQNNQAAHANSRSFSVPSIPSMHGFTLSSPTGTGLNPNDFNSLPMISTSHGMVHDHSIMASASLVPQHSESSPVNAQVPTQFSQAHQPAPVYVQYDQPPPKLKRSYTYGTDSDFNPNGYAAPSPNAEQDATQRLMKTIKYAQVHDPEQKPVAIRGSLSSGGDEPSEETSDEADEEARPKKRRKGKTSVKEENPPTSRRKGSSTARPAKNRNDSTDESSNKKKRGSVAGQKAARENLTEEQKRSNHIMSEQKRRNLIKRGFDDLHDLVPEIRAGGLSKSHILLEAAGFLEKVIADNESYKEMSKFPDG